MMEQVLGGLQILMTWQNFLVIPIGLIIGIVVGAIPGLTSDLGIILRRLHYGHPHQHAGHLRQRGNAL